MLSTLCYIERDGQYLMLLRNRKKKDINKGKWIGVGGHFLPGETPEECLLREVREETGLTLLNWQFRGIVTFQQNDDEAEYMHLFTADEFSGELLDCDEGELSWIPKDRIFSLNLWEGDRVFLEPLLQDVPCFTSCLRYDGDHLLKSEIKVYVDRPESL